MRTKLLPMSLLLAAILASVGLGSAPLIASTVPQPQLHVPEGFGYADARLDGEGNGFVLWKNTDGSRSKLQRLEALAPAGEWSFDSYLAKGFHWDGGNRILIQGISAKSDDLRLYELRGDHLERIWDSARLSEALEMDPERLFVSGDFRWWFGANYYDSHVEIVAGQLLDVSPSFRWIVQESNPDAFLASLVEVESARSENAKDAPPSLALTFEGKAWFLSPQTQKAIPLAVPPECRAIASLEDGRDGLWAHCGEGVHLLYATLSPRPGDGGLEPASVVHARKLQILSSGVAVAVERRHRQAGVLTELRLDEVGDVRASAPPRSFPLPLGVAGHIAGDQLLIPVPPDARAPRAYRVVALGSLGPAHP